MKQQKILKIYEEFMTNVYRYAYSKLGNKAEAEDATSETFLAFIQNNNKVQDPHAWLIGTCRNIIYKKFRDKPQIQEIELLENDIPDEQPVENEAVDEQLLAEIKADLQKLDEVTREIITLKIWEDLKFGEIATILNVSENTVKAKYYRGLKQLSEKQTKMRAVAIPLLLLVLPQLASAAEYTPNASFGELLKSQISNNFNLSNTTVMNRIIAKISSLPLAAKLVVAVLLVSCVVGLLILFIYLNQPASQNPDGQNSSSPSSLSSSATSEEQQKVDRIVYKINPDSLGTEIWVINSDGTGKEMIYAENQDNKYVSDPFWKRHGELNFIECVHTTNYSTVSSDSCTLINLNLETKKLEEDIKFNKGYIREFKWAPNLKDYAYSFSSDERTTTYPGSTYMSNAIEFHYVKDGIDTKVVLAGVLVGSDRQYETGITVDFNDEGKLVTFGDYFAVDQNCPSAPSQQNTCTEVFKLYIYNVATGEGKWVSDQSYGGNQTLSFVAYDGQKMIYEDLERDAFFSYDFTSSQITNLGKRSDTLRAQIKGLQKMLINNAESIENVGTIDRLSEYSKASGSVVKIGDNLHGVGYLLDGSILAIQSEPKWSMGQFPSHNEAKAIIKIGENGLITLTELPSVPQYTQRLSIVVEPR